MTAAKLADDSVVTANIVDGNVTAVKTTGVGKGRILSLMAKCWLTKEKQPCNLVLRLVFQLIEFYVGTNAIGTFQYTQSTDVPAGFGNSLKIQCTTVTLVWM